MKRECQLCGSRARIDRHHVSYDPPEVVLLCRRCHNFVHFTGYTIEYIKKLMETAKGKYGFVCMTPRSLVSFAIKEFVFQPTLIMNFGKES